MNQRDQTISAVSQRLRRELNDPATSHQRRREIGQEWQLFLATQTTTSNFNSSESRSNAN